MTLRRWARIAAALPAAVALAALAPLAPAATAAGPGGVPGPSGAPVRAADRPAVGAGALSVQIASFTPAIPAAGEVLRVTGTITNTSEEPVRDVSAVLRLSSPALPSRGEIPEVLAGAGNRVGLPVAGASDAVAESLAPGQSAEFALRARVDALPLAGPGVYVTGAEAVGDSGAGIVRQDIDRTFLPWWPEGTTAEPLELTTLWPLIGAPLRDTMGALLSDEPAVEMSPAGRLATLLAAAADAPGAVSLVVDPQVVEAAAEMSGGYVVGLGDSARPGTRSSEVADWLAALRRAVADPDADVIAMLYGQPDVVAARHGGLLGTLLRQHGSIDAITQEVLGRPLPAELVLVPDGTATSATLRRLARAEVPVTVLSDAALPPVEPSYYTPIGTAVLSTRDGDLPVLATDSGLSMALSMPMDSAAEQTAARQRLLAETLVTITELPRVQRLLVAAPDPGWAPPAEAARMVVGVLGSTPWLVPTGVAAALDLGLDVEPHRLAGYDEEAAGRELPASHVQRVESQFDDLAEYEAVLSDPDDLPPSAPTAPTRGMSAWFRSHPEKRVDLTRAVDDQLDAALASVRIISSGSITVSGASGTIPMTVENVGSVPVTVGVSMVSTPPQLFQADPVEPFRIEPERRTSVEITAQVAAAGPVPVSIQLTTAAGEPFGRPGQLVVQSSAYAKAARIIVQVALGALVLAVLVHGVRRARRSRRPAAQPTDGSRTSEVTGG